MNAKNTSKQAIIIILIIVLMTVLMIITKLLYLKHCINNSINESKEHEVGLVHRIFFN